MKSIDAGANAGRRSAINALLLSSALIAPSIWLSSAASAQTARPGATELPAVEITAPQPSR
ncbi:hypothetical protein, partial [Rhodopseudomonas sp. AAP120]|uniref:hypothetical protein n=1 Tax=Rhodopseudomonas sp. AAP120 TaxID=1523430 RepID=UPI001AEBBC61